LDFVNLLVDLGDARFAQRPVHHAIEACDRAGTYVWREHATPEAVLGWIDGAFGGTWSSEAAAGGAWLARDADGLAGFCAFDARNVRYPWLRAWRDRPEVGLFGPLGVAERARGRGLGAVLLHAALFALRERGYREALVPAVGAPGLIEFYERHASARVVETFSPFAWQRRARTTVLASGNGSNFEAVAKAARDGRLPLDITALVVNAPGVYAVARAARAGVATQVLAWSRERETRAAYDARLRASVEATEPELVLLLGWMHLLDEAFVGRFAELLNLHPAFLPLDPELDVVTMPDGTQSPAFRGARAVDAALAAGGGWSGATLHRVGLEVDRGAVQARAPLALAAGEPRDALDARLHALERQVVLTGLRRWMWERDAR